jgi:cysteine desulfurase/selenocysteine lyase
MVNELMSVAESHILTAETLDVEEIRRNFPIFYRPENEELVYLDNAATVQRPRQVLDAIVEFYIKHNANPHRGAYRLSEQATEQQEKARGKVARFIGAGSSEQIVFTRNATEAINFVARGWGDKFIKPGNEIVVSMLEHHSNLVPWQMAAKRTGATLRFIPFDAHGNLILDDLDKIINSRTKLVAITQASNSLGTMPPLDRIIAAAHAVGARVLVDGAQAVAHIPVNVARLDADFYAFSGHKMMGPLGIGVLYGKSQWLEEMDPVHFGGDMISDVRQYDSTWNEMPWKFEAGTQNIAGAVGLAAAIDFIKTIGLERIRAHDRSLTVYALEELDKIDQIKVYGPGDARAPVISFELAGIHPHDLATFLDQKNIAIRAGHHCAKLVMKSLGVSSTARISFYIYNSLHDIDFFIAALHEAKGFFSKWR